MKKNVFIFILVALLALTIAPVINLIKLGNPLKTETKWWEKTTLYNFDFTLPVFNYFFYQLGISGSPNQVIIGKDDWLYLGDQYRQTLSVTRYGATNEHIEAAKKINVATKAWDQWLKSKGIRQYQIMLAPNKSSIYPEFLPDWIQPATPSALNTLLAHVSPNLYIDTRTAVESAKSKFSMPLYYKTDSHWNAIGAWVAFHTFTSEVSRTNTDLRWISEQQVHISKVINRSGGDLSLLLRIMEILQDSEVVLDIASKKPFNTEWYDFETGHLISSGGNPAVLIQHDKPPIIVKSKQALNKTKVLWIHDSFGTELEPFMAVTFTETLQVHYLAITSKQFAKLVESYKPEYVFITVTERDAIDPWFQNLPPT